MLAVIPRITPEARSSTGIGRPYPQVIKLLSDRINVFSWHAHAESRSGRVGSSAGWPSRKHSLAERKPAISRSLELLRPNDRCAYRSVEYAGQCPVIRGGGRLHVSTVKMRVSYIEGGSQEARQRRLRETGPPLRSTASNALPLMCQVGTPLLLTSRKPLSVISRRQG